jgi:prepilin-type N-terminal cleavage/methylation domain-containing protein
MRRGLTLIEMLVSIAVLSALLTLSVTLLVRLLQAQTSGAQALASSLSLGRLAHDFRRDAHDAVQAESVADMEGTTALRFVADTGDTVTYRASPKAIERIATRAAQPPQRETYRHGAAEAKFELALDGQLAAIILRRGAEQAASAARPLSEVPPVELRIEAAVGIHNPSAPEEVR